jgi:hypothetical protein
MRGHFIKALLDRMLPESRPDEDFFSVGFPRREPLVAATPRRVRRESAASVTVAAAHHRHASGV